MPEPEYAETPACAETRELVPELAAGVTTGEVRARALAHLARCRFCRQELDEVTKVVDELLLLAPDSEPPAGFETSVLARLTPGRRTRWPTLKRVILQAAALVFVAGLAGGGVLWQTRDERELAAHYQETLDEAHGRYLVAADLVAAGTPEAGHVFAYEGSPPWLFVTVSAEAEPGPYQIQMVTRDGRLTDLGTVTVRDGAAGWGANIGVHVRDIRLVQLVPADRPGAGPAMAARFGSR